MLSVNSFEATADAATSSGGFNSFEDVLNALWGWCTTTGIKIIIALAIGFLGFAIINAIVAHIKKQNIKHNFDKTLGVTLRKVISWSLKILLIMILLSYVGIEVSGIAAVVAAAGVTIGLALQGALSNVAGGILIITMRPFRLDDFIEAQGVSGTVEDIRLVYTYIRTLDNKVVALPNGALANGTISNYSAKTTRRVEIKFSVAYSEDYKKAQEVVLQTAAKNNMVLTDPAPGCRITEHGTSSVILFSTFWCKTENYWSVFFDMQEQVKSAFDQNGIKIPFTQLDVHLDDKTAKTLGAKAE